MSGIGEQTGGKSPGDLAAEAFWFFAHSFISLLVYVGLLGVVQMIKPQSPSMLLATVLAFATTGPGLCEHCGALAKLIETLVTFNHPSGLLYGSGNALGTWPALANIGYALGAKFALKKNV